MRIVVLGIEEFIPGEVSRSPCPLDQHRHASAAPPVAGRITDDAITRSLNRVLPQALPSVPFQLSIASHPPCQEAIVIANEIAIHAVPMNPAPPSMNTRISALFFGHHLEQRFENRLQSDEENPPAISIPMTRVRAIQK